MVIHMDFTRTGVLNMIIFSTLQIKELVIKPHQMINYIFQYYKISKILEHIRIKYYLCQDIAFGRVWVAVYLIYNQIFYNSLLAYGDRLLDFSHIGGLLLV